MQAFPHCVRPALHPAAHLPRSHTSLAAQAVPQAPQFAGSVRRLTHALPQRESPALHWQPPVRFVEAAMALSIAYLAVEILFLPEAGMRWLVAGILGGFHGLSLYLVLEGSGFHPSYVLGGAAISELTVIAILAFVIWMLERRWTIIRLVKPTAAVLLVFGMTWFFLRVKS